MDFGFFQIDIDELSYPHIDQLQAALARCPANAKSDLSLAAYCDLRFCQGVSAYYQEQYTSACERFEGLLSLSPELEQPEFVACTRELTARVYARLGQYSKATSELEKALDLAEQQNRVGIAASVHLSQGWVLFQRGKHQAALRVLEKARPTFEKHGDQLSLGNLHWTIARVLKRDGHFAQAFEELGKAGRHYQDCKAHAAYAGVYIRQAFLKHLMFYRWEGTAVADEEKKALVEDGFGLLHVASELIKSKRLPRTKASYHRTSFCLHLDQAAIQRRIDPDQFGSEVELAQGEVEKAWGIALESGDDLLKARAAVQQCQVNLILADQPPAKHSHGFYADRAASWAAIAVDSACSSQNLWLLAKVNIWKSRALIRSHNFDLEGAVSCYREAQKSLESGDGQSAFSDRRDDNVLQDFKQLQVDLSRLTCPESALDHIRHALRSGTSRCKSFDWGNVTGVELVEWEVSPQRSLVVQCSACRAAHCIDVPSEVSSPLQWLFEGFQTRKGPVVVAA